MSAENTDEKQSRVDPSKLLCNILSDFSGNILEWPVTFDAYTTMIWDQTIVLVMAALTLQTAEEIQEPKKKKISSKGHNHLF